MTTLRFWQNGAAIVVVGFLLIFGWSSAPSTLDVAQSNEAPAVSMPSAPDSVPTVPGGHDALREPADPDAEPIVRLWKIGSAPPVVLAIVVDDLRHPGFPLALERPPKA